MTVVGGALHPVEVGAGREAFSSSGEDDDADVVIFIEGDAGGGEFGDQDFVKGVVAVGAVHPDRGDRAGEFDLQGLKGHGFVSEEFLFIGLGDFVWPPPFYVPLGRYPLGQEDGAPSLSRGGLGRGWVFVRFV
jgi:hypothetical protein